MLLTNSKVRQVHTLQVFGSISVKALVQASAIFGLLSALCLTMFELTSKHLSAQLFFLDLSFAVTFVQRVILYMILSQFSPGFALKSQVN